VKKIDYKMLSLSLFITFLVTLVPACFQNLQYFDAEKAMLTLGFPFDFYMIKFTANSSFAIHFNISGFLANIVVIYFLLILLEKLIGRKNKAAKR